MSAGVFLAEDDEGTRVVLKVLAAPRRNQGLLQPRIVSEATAYASLAHPNIVKVEDLFSADGRFVVALEYVEGATLNVVRAAMRRGGVTIEDGTAMYAATCVFAAIAAAHSAKDAQGNAAPVLHRNVNPSNIHLAWNGAVKLGNFNIAGAAKVLRDSSPGFSWGNYGYFAPEQVQNERAGPAADVYAASMILWELLAGRKAIERGTMTDEEVLAQMANPRVPPLAELRPDVDERVREAIDAGLRPDPRQRTIGAATMFEVLSGAIDEDQERGKLVELLARVRPLTTRPTAKPEIVLTAAPPRTPSKPKMAASQLAQAQVEKAPLPREASPAPPKAAEPEETPPKEATPSPKDATPKPEEAAPQQATPKLELPVAPVQTNGAVAIDSARRAPSRAVPLAFVAAAALAATIVFALRPRPSIAPAAIPATATAATATTAISSAGAPVAAASSSPPAPVPIPSDMGRVDLPPGAAGHRVYADGRVVGDGSQSVLVRCGKHEMRLGSTGAAQDVDVPCGRSVMMTMH